MPRKSTSTRSRKAASRKAASGKKAARHRSDSKQRLQRLLASAGFGSRRQCEELIESGRVTLDGTVVTRLGTTVDPNVSKVRVDGVLLKKQKLVYFAVNKPVGFVTTNRDPQGRPRVIDMVPRDERVFPVGRLDRNSEGLILLTNDGELAQALTHPKFGVRKIYRVTVAGKVDSETMKQMRKGIYIAEGFVRVEGAKLLKSRSRSTEMEIVLREGKNREIRRILARLGHKVQHLRRIAVGPLRLGDVPPGAYRIVSHQEVEKLWRATETSTDSEPDKRGGKKHAAKKRVGTSTRRPLKKGSGKKVPGKKVVGRKVAGRKDAGKRREAAGDQQPRPFVFDQPQTTGSVIGMDSDSTTSGTDKRGRKQTKGKRGTGAKNPRGGTGRTGGGTKKRKSEPDKRGQSPRTTKKRNVTKRKRKN